MKGYGLPRTLDIEYPDLVDIQIYALKTSTGQIKSKGGDYRGSARITKRTANRRLWKKMERNRSKCNIKKEISDYNEN